MKISRVLGVISSAIICLDSSTADAQSRGATIRSRDYENRYTVVYGLRTDRYQPPFYQVTLCAPRTTAGGTLESFWLTLEDAEDNVRFSVTTAAVEDGDFAVLDFGVSDQDLRMVRIFARFYGETPLGEHGLRYIDQVDLERLLSEAIQIEINAIAANCKEITSAVAGTAADDAAK